MTYIEAYEIDKGERIKAEIISSDETAHQWRRSLEELDSGLPEYARPLKVGWSPPRKKVNFKRVLSGLLP